MILQEPKRRRSAAAVGCPPKNRHSSGQVVREFSRVSPPRTLGHHRPPRWPCSRLPFQSEFRPRAGSFLSPPRQSQLLAGLAPNDGVPNRVSADFCQCAEPSTHFFQNPKKPLYMSDRITVGCKSGLGSS